ncbi:hypothetical protein C882_3156 [Caenispirillum salinarum AK4]|uniref:Uncharacterized protein n=1 Tax=Caenispirillum salinarum AK4 TaxID=1238182 RepID=K9H3G3_9PROT|nr:hypothetical protein [Caenispirillum salinarum]EKV32092.1 hypothetical protein C882_3156 [Caenispirillum salinarum AK4]
MSDTRTGTGQAMRDPSRAFLLRLVEAAKEGQRLGDPRDVETLKRWVRICEGIPDGPLMQIVPTTIRALFGHADYAPVLQATGLDRKQPLQHEAISPYVVAYRRYVRARRNTGNPGELRDTIDTLRRELRDLKAQFDAVFDNAMKLEEERARLASENESLQQRVLHEQLRADEATRALTEARQKAFRLFRVYLFLLKEERERLSNDPMRERLLTAEVAVETHSATLEALGMKDDAEAQALEILGQDLFQEYFRETDSRRVPDPETLQGELFRARERAGSGPSDGGAATAGSGDGEARPPFRPRVVNDR